MSPNMRHTKLCSMALVLPYSLLDNHLPIVIPSDPSSLLFAHLMILTSLILSLLRWHRQPRLHLTIMRLVCN
jgi:hypothetical protein